MLLLKAIEYRLRSAFREQEDPSDLLERVAYHLAQTFTTTASFRSRGFLLPEQDEALSLVIALEREIRHG